MMSGYDEPPILPGEFCEAARIRRAAPQRDDPYYEHEIGPCPSWPGCGCEWDLPWPIGGCEGLELEDLDEHRE